MRSDEAERDVTSSAERWAADPTEDNRVELTTTLMMSIALKERTLTCVDDILARETALAPDVVAELVVGRARHEEELERTRFRFTDVTGLQP